MKRRFTSRIVLVAPLAFAFSACVGSADPAPSTVAPVEEALTGPIYEMPRCNLGRWKCKSRLRVDASGAVANASTSLGATDLQSAYKLDPTLKGLTIAITDAFAYPNAESDMAAYRSKYGLAPCTVASGCLTIVNQDGK